VIHHSLTQELEHRGISRREFMGFCASMAAVHGTAGLCWPQAIAAAVETEARPILVWLEFQDCCGKHGVFVKRAGHPTVADLILDSISLNYHETLMAAAGSQAENCAGSKPCAIMQGKYIALVEGSIPYRRRWRLLHDRWPGRLWISRARYAETPRRPSRSAPAQRSAAFRSGPTEPDRCACPSPTRFPASKI
jgi:NiFe hydrogenase small subunit HydA